MSRRRAVSQIIGTLIMLGVVAVAGGVLFIKGIQVLTDFNTEVSAQTDTATDKIKEKIIISHVRFHTNNQATIYLRNVGEVEAEIASIKVINVDDQTLEYSDTPTTTDLFIQDPVEITITLATNPFSTSEEYKFSILTSRDNTFTKFVTPPNG